MVAQVFGRQGRDLCLFARIDAHPLRDRLVGVAPRRHAAAIDAAQVPFHFQLLQVAAHGFRADGKLRRQFLDRDPAMLGQFFEHVLQTCLRMIGHEGFPGHTPIGQSIDPAFRAGSSSFIALILPVSMQFAVSSCRMGKRVFHQKASSQVLVATGGQTGLCLRQRPKACGQRLAKLQPGGRSIGLGGSPSSRQSSGL